MSGVGTYIAPSNTSGVAPCTVLVTYTLSVWVVPNARFAHAVVVPSPDTDSNGFAPCET